MIPPNNIDIESAILGSCILSQTALLTTIEQVEPIDFYLENNRIIYQAIQKLFKENKKVDSLGIITILNDSGNLDAVGGHNAIIGLTQSCTTTSILYYIKKLKEYSKRRALIKLSNTAHEQAHLINDDLTEILSELNKNFRDITEEKTDTCVDIAELAKSDFTAKTDCIKTGFEALDKFLYGLFRQEVALIAARPSVGKTSLALNIAENVALEYPVLFYSLEMPARSLLIRLLSGETGIHFRRIQMGWTSTDEENEKLKQAREKISKLKLKIDDQPGLNIDKILARSERINQSTKLGLIVIDYMQLITTSLKGTTNDKVSDISHKIKDLSRFCNVPVIALSQLSRGIEARVVKTPLLSDLRDSGSLEQDADTVIFLYRDEDEIIYDDRPSVRNLSVAKQRNGATGISSLLFHQKKMRFTDI